MFGPKFQLIVYCIFCVYIEREIQIDTHTQYSIKCVNNLSSAFISRLIAFDWLVCLYCIVCSSLINYYTEKESDYSFTSLGSKRMRRKKNEQITVTFTVILLQHNKMSILEFLYSFLFMYFFFIFFFMIMFTWNKNNDFYKKYLNSYSI